jgi:hypothetical protein
MSSVGHSSESICGNWIAVSREMRDHYLVGFGQPVKPDDPKRGAFSRAEAWLDLIMLARWKDGTEMNKGRRTEMRAGQFQGGYSFLASRWNWTIQTVRTFVGKLLGERMLERVEEPSESNKQKANQVQVLSLCNYKKYQLITELMTLQQQQASNKRATSEQQHLNKENKILSSSEAKASSEDSLTAAPLSLFGEPLVRPEEVPQKPKIKGAKMNPGERRKKTPAGEYSREFGFFWEIYPRQVGKGEAFASWQRLTLDQQRRAYVALKAQLPALTARLNENGKNVCPHPSTWINQGRFDDAPEALRVPQRGADKPKFMRTRDEDFEAYKRATELSGAMYD